MERRRRSRERKQRGEKEKSVDPEKTPGFPCSSGVCSGGEDAYLKPLEADGVDRSLSSYRAWELTAPLSDWVFSAVCSKP